MTIVLIFLAVLILIFPRLLVWAMVGVFLWFLIPGIYAGLKQKGARKRKPGHSTASADWKHLTDD
jgi:hypothetical protein